MYGEILMNEKKEITLRRKADLLVLISSGVSDHSFNFPRRPDWSHSFTRRLISRRNSGSLTKPGGMIPPEIPPNSSRPSSSLSSRASWGLVMERAATLTVLALYPRLWSKTLHPKSDPNRKINLNPTHYDKMKSKIFNSINQNRPRTANPTKKSMQDTGANIEII